MDQWTKVCAQVRAHALDFEKIVNLLMCLSFCLDGTVVHINMFVYIRLESI